MVAYPPDIHGDQELKRTRICGRIQPGPVTAGLFLQHSSSFSAVFQHLQEDKMASFCPPDSPLPLIYTNNTVLREYIYSTMRSMEGSRNSEEDCDPVSPCFRKCCKQRLNSYQCGAIIESWVSCAPIGSSTCCKTTSTCCNVATRDVGLLWDRWGNVGNLHFPCNPAGDVQRAAAGWE